MNKRGFIAEVEKQTGYPHDKAIIISESLEDNFLFGKSNKCKTIIALMENLNVDEEEANRIYDITSSIIVNAIKTRIKHPFKNLDKENKK
ncbi:MAG: hypothetical protein J5892_02335 [Bacilli bacterium]|nr:hypothetical protein [Bacilli bacterium]